MTEQPSEDAPKRRRKPKPTPVPEPQVAAPQPAVIEPEPAAIESAAKPPRTRSRKTAKPALSPVAEQPTSQLDLLAAAPVHKPAPVLESLPVLEALPAAKPVAVAVLESLPTPAETPAVQPTSGPSMADRANRYARRPPSSEPERAPPPPPMSMADRARRSSQFHRGPEPAAADRPKPLDMAEIAARNRQARDAARVERLPESLPQAVAVPTGPRPSPTMAERSARHIQTHLVREEDRRPQPVAPAVLPPAAIAEAEGPSMAERAAEAAHRRREEGPAQRTSSPATAGPQAAIGSAAVVLVTRNHARMVRERLRSWMDLVSAVDVRWLVLDLGSTDDSVEEAERARARVVLRPGGLVEPLAAIDAVVREAAADIVLVIDADAEPHPAIIDLIGVVRAGHAAAVAPERHPVAMAVARQAWLAQARPDDVDAAERAQRAGGMRRLAGGAVQPEITGLIARAVDAPHWRHLLKRIQRARALVRGLLQRFGG